MTLFHEVFPEIPLEGVRVVRVPPNPWGVPTIDYALLDAYCVDPGCDCRCVRVQFFPREPLAAGDGPQSSAKLYFGWERALYYKELARHGTDGGDWKRESGVSLDPSETETPINRFFLKILEELIEDPEIVALFRRRYLLVKEFAREGKSPSS